MRIPNLRQKIFFRPYTIEKWVEKKFVSDFDEIVKQGAAVYLLKNEGSTVLGAMFWNLAGFFRTRKRFLSGIFLVVVLISLLIAIWYSEGILRALGFLGTFFGFIFATYRVLIPPPRKTLLVGYREDNQDAIIDQSLPYSINKSLLDKWIGYQSSNKTTEHEIKMGQRMEAAAKNNIYTILHHYETLFGPRSIARPESYHEHEWQMVGVWALATPKPEKDAKWEERKNFGRICQTRICKSNSAYCKKS